ncbi:MAG: 1-acyl-sn-glycerol-3-phosphate acyltransferase [Solirubrobacterales bacterium]|nr:1-acyl-sn-glycerol-3-phosphate acyltransferase [Solirubrobacterales bacterium]
MPPVSIRRPVTVVLWLIVSTCVVLASPLLLVLGKLASAVTRRPQPLIATRLTLAYFGYELAALIGCGALWLGAGCGLLIRTRRWQALHWRLLRWFVRGLAGAGRRALGIDVDAELSTDAASALESEQPLIVLSRHAGPGDTIFIVDQLMSRFRRRPSVVFKDSLALDPCIDLLAHRLPQAMLDQTDRDEAEEIIGRVTTNLEQRGVLLLFPEGGNFTPERRRSALRRLRQRGKRRSAEQAEQMPHVLPPKPSGTLAALGAGGQTDIVFAAHTGLGLAAYPKQIWRHMPIGRTLQTRMWFVPASEVPAGDEERIVWLYDWWKRIDEWIDAQSQEAGVS